jgi:Protein of unknown function (DUF1579)
MTYTYSPAAGLNAFMSVKGDQLMRKLVAVFVIATASFFLLAQQGADQPEGQKPETQKPEAQQSQQPGQESAAPAGMPAKPAPEMERLAKTLVGTWSTSEKFEPSPEMGMPNGATGKGTEVVKRGPGGLSLVADYRSRNAMGSFAGHGVTYWDPNEKAYKSFWIDSMGGKGEISTGKWEGNDLVFTGESEFQGKKYSNLQKFTNITPNSFTFKMSSSVDGGEMKDVLTINYKKAVGAASAKQAAKQ